MKLFNGFFLPIIASLSLTAQDVEFKATILNYPSLKPEKGLTIKLADGAHTRTDENGVFVFTFIDKNPGDVIHLRPLLHEGYKIKDISLLPIKVEIPDGPGAGIEYLICKIGYCDEPIDYLKRFESLLARLTEKKALEDTIISLRYKISLLEKEKLENDKILWRLSQRHEDKVLDELIAAGNIDEAIVLLERRENEPNVSRIEDLRLLADLYYVDFQWDKAEEGYRSIWKADSTNWERIFDLAVFFGNTNQYFEALKWLDEAVNLSNDKMELANSYFNLGLIYTLLGETKQAHDNLLDAIRIFELLAVEDITYKELQAEGLLILGLYNLDEDRFFLSQDYLLKADDILSDLAQEYESYELLEYTARLESALGVSNLNTGYLKHAEKNFNRALSIQKYLEDEYFEFDPFFMVETLYSYSHLKLEQDNYDSARLLLEEALKIPTNINTYDPITDLSLAVKTSLTSTYFLQEDTTKAVSQLEELISLIDSSNLTHKQLYFDTQTLLADFYANKHEYTLAERHIQYALDVALKHKMKYEIAITSIKMIGIGRKLGKSDFNEHINIIDEAFENMASDNEHYNPMMLIKFLKELYHSELLNNRFLRQEELLLFVNAWYVSLPNHLEYYSEDIFHNLVRLSSIYMQQLHIFQHDSILNKAKLTLNEAHKYGSHVPQNDQNKLYFQVLQKNKNWFESGTPSNDPNLNLCLSRAADKGDPDLTEILINKGADINFINSKGYTAIQMACQNGAEELFFLLIEKGASTDVLTSNQESLVHLAIRSENIAILDELLTLGLSIETKAQIDVDLFFNKSVSNEDSIRFIQNTIMSDVSPLMLAVFNGSSKMVEYLIKHGADYTEKNAFGLTPLTVTAMHGSYHIARKLFEAGANISKTDYDGFTFLHFAAVHGSLECIELAVELGLDLEAKATSQGITPLHQAGRLNQVDAVKLLIQLGSNINARTKDNVTISHIAARAGNTELIKFLLENGANLELKDSHGYTPLLVAVERGHVQTSKLLLNHNADKNVRTNEGRGIVDLALLSGNMELISMMQE